MAFGRLERSTAPRPMSDINMTPLIDVMLVLVVIFILTAPLLVSSLRLDLPRSSAAKPQDAASAVQLSLERSGVVYLNDQAITLAELEQRLVQISADNPQTEVQLRADAAVAYGRVVEVMGIAHKTGLSRIGFVADSQMPSSGISR